MTKKAPTTVGNCTVAEHGARVHSTTSDIQRAVQVLRNGGLVAFPTETVYGLGADAENHNAVERIFTVKGRPATHPLILHIGSADDLTIWTDKVPLAARRLAEHFWPGPLSLVLNRSRRVSSAVTGGLETVAVRVPAHPVALALIRSFGGALAAPSANRFGAVSPTAARHVRDELGDAIDLVLDGGLCAVGVESTIVDATGEELCILRPGGLSREDLEGALGHAISMRTTAGSVRVPGSHASHYAPRAEVIFVDPTRLASEAENQASHGHQVGVLLPHNIEIEHVPVLRVLRAPQSLADYGRMLYPMLREFDRCGCDVICVSLPVEEGIGVAIADRLRRAAGPRNLPERNRVAVKCHEPEES